MLAVCIIQVLTLSGPATEFMGLVVEVVILCGSCPIHHVMKNACP
jgi:hypothetical protein